MLVASSTVSPPPQLSPLTVRIKQRRADENPRYSYCKCKWRAGNAVRVSGRARTALALQVRPHQQNRDSSRNCAGTGLQGWICMSETLGLHRTENDFYLNRGNNRHKRVMWLQYYVESHDNTGNGHSPVQPCPNHSCLVQSTKQSFLFREKQLL